MKGLKLPGLWGIIAANPGADSASSLLRDGIALEEPGVEGGFPFRMRLRPFKSAEGLLPGCAGFPGSGEDTPGAAFPQQPEAQVRGRGSPAAAPGPPLPPAAVHAPVSGEMWLHRPLCRSPVVLSGSLIPHLVSPLVRCWCDA